MRGRHHRQRVPRDVDAVLETAAVHLGELGTDALGRNEVGDIQVNVGHALSQHLGVDAARDDVARRKVLPLRVVTVHERLPLLIDQARARAPHGFRDQEAGRIAVIERRRMELDVFGVDDARAGAVCHRESVAARAGRIRRAQEDLAQAAGGQHGGAGEAAIDLAGALVVDVRADARQRIVHGAPIAALVRRRQQVDGGVVREQANARMRAQRLDQLVLDGTAGGIGGVHDAGNRVPSFPAQREAAVGRAIERHAELVDQDRLDERRALVGKGANRLLVAKAGAGIDDVLRQRPG